MVTASIIGNCQYIKEHGGNTPTTKVILHLTPHPPLLVTIVVDFSVSPWTIVTYYCTQDISDINKKMATLLTENESSKSLKKLSTKKRWCKNQIPEQLIKVWL